MLDLKKFCSKNSIKIRKNYDFGKCRGFNVPGKVTYYIEISDVRKLCDFLYFAKNNKLKVLGIASGTNVLIDDEYDSILINFTGKKLWLTNINSENNIKIVKAQAGVSKKSLIKFCIKKECSGIEFWSGIPGSVSGGVAMNAGAYQNEISKHVLDIEFASPDGIKKLCSGELEWDYRNLKIPNYYIITSVSFITHHKKFIDIKNECENYIIDRNNKHPLYFHSCGSTFKNPNNPNIGAWKLIKDAGLSGYQIGGAKISLLHSNFIITNGSDKTSSKDIISLINHIKETIKNKYNIKLEEEIRILS